jgi:large subunit ribosomal protein L9
MKVFLLQDVLRVGKAGMLLEVADGYAVNFLFPRKLAVEVGAHNHAEFERRMTRNASQQEVVAAKTSLLAERIKVLRPTLRVKMHDATKLYAAVSAAEVVALLAQEGVSVSKNQILFEHAIKTKGLHPVTVKLSNSLQPVFTLKVASE